MASYSYAGLRVFVTADTRGLESAVRSAAQSAGQDASKRLSTVMSAGLRGLGSAAGTVGKSMATGLAVATTATAGFGAASFKAAARVGEMDATLRALAKANGLSYDAMQSNVQSIRHAGIEYGVAQSTVAEFAKNQLSLSKSTDLARVAQDAAVVSGQNSTETLDQLIHGIVTQNSLVLRNAGIQVDATQAQDAYAKSVGKTRKELTPAEKSQALLNAVLKQGKSVAGAYTAAMKEPGKVLRSYPRVINDIMVSVGQGLVKAIGPAILKGYDFAKALSAALAPGSALVPVVTAIGTTVGQLIAPVTRMIERWTAWIKALKPEQVRGIAGKIREFGPAAIAAAGGLTAMVAPSILSGIPVIGPLLGSLLGPLGMVKDGAVSLGKGLAAQLIPGLSGAIGPVGGLTGALGQAGLLGPLAAVAAGFGTLMAVSPEFRQTVMDIVKALVSALMPAFRAIIDGTKPLLPVVADLAKLLGAVLAGALQQIVPLLAPLGKILGQVITGVLRALAPLLPEVARAALALARSAGELLAAALPLVPLFMSLLRAVMPLLPPLVQLAVAILRPLTAVLAAVAAWIGKMAGWLIPLTAAVLAGVAAWKAYKLALLAVQLGPTAIGLKVLAARQMAMAAASKVAAAGQWLLNAALSANPVGIIVVALAALVAGLVVAYQRSQAFRDVVAAAFGFVRGVFDTVVKAAQALWHWITGGSPGLVPAFQALMSVVRPVASFLAGAVTGALRAVQGAVSALTGFAGRLAGGLATAVAAAGRFLVNVGGVLARLPGLFAKAAADAITRLRNGIAAAAAGIGGWAWTTVIQPVLNFLGRLPGRLLTLGRDAISSLRDAIRAAASGIGNWAWTTVIQPVLTFYARLPGRLADLGRGGIRSLRDAISGAASGIGNWAWTTVIQPVLTRLRDAPGQLLSIGRDAINGLKNGFLDAIAGIGGWVKSNIVDPVVNAVKSWFGIHSPSSVMAEVGGNVMAGLLKGIVEGGATGFVTKVFGGMPEALGGLLSKGLAVITELPQKALSALGKLGGALGGVLGKIGGFLGLGGGGAGVAQWQPLMESVLAMVGHPELLPVFMRQMMTESGGNPRAINLWDINAKRGTPSMGLMQVIQPTFDAYAGPFRSRGIWDPLANIYAAVAYAIRRYGARVASVLGAGHGYARGGIITEPVTGFGLRSGEPYSFAERGWELVSPLSGPGADLRGIGRAQRGTVINVYPREHQDERAIAAAVSRELAWAQAGGRA